MFYEHLKFNTDARSHLQSSSETGEAVPVAACTELVAEIIADIDGGGAVIGVRGVHGVGKSFFAGLLAGQLAAPAFRSVQAAGASACPASLQRQLANAAGLREERPDPARLLGALQAEFHTRRLVLVIDDAERLGAAAFLYCWQMLNLCRMKAVHLHIVLIGQIGAWPGLNGPALTDMRRASISDHMIRGMTKEESAAYLDRKLRQTGVAAAQAMSRRAADALLEQARGVPGRLDELAGDVVNYARQKRASRISLWSLRKARLIDRSPTPMLDYLRPLLGLPAIGAAATVFIVASIFVLAGAPDPAPTGQDLARLEQQRALRADIELHSILRAPAPLPTHLAGVAKPAPPAPAPTLATNQAAQSPDAGPAAAPAALREAQLAAPAAPATAYRPPGPPGHGLVLVAMQGDTMDNLYRRVYRGLAPPPYTEVVAANQLPIRQGSLVVFPEPPHGWSVP